MGQEKWKERGTGEKAESKTRKNESKFAVSAHGPNFGSEILHLEQKPAKCSNYRRRFDQFGLFT